MRRRLIGLEGGGAGCRPKGWRVHVQLCSGGVQQCLQTGIDGCLLQAMEALCITVPQAQQVPQFLSASEFPN